MSGGTGGGKINRKIVFGTRRADAESLGLSTTGSTTLQEKLKLTTATIPAGDYMIFWSFSLGNDTKSKSTTAQVQVDDTNTLSACVISDNTEDDYSFMQSGHAIVPLTAGVHEVDIDFAQGGEGETATIQDARLTMWRFR